MIRKGDHIIDDASLAEGERLARNYRIVLQPHERKGFQGTVLEMPTVFAFGSDPTSCVNATYETLAVGLASMIDEGVEPPPPVTERKRTCQMNVRLTAEEKLILQETASQRGYRSASDYVRTVALKDSRRRNP